EIKAVLEKHRVTLLRHPLVRDIGVGFRVADRKVSDELCAIVEVTSLANASLQKKSLPQSIEGIPVHLVETLVPEILRADFDELHPHIRDISNFRNQLFPQLIGGIRIKNARSREGGGTLGAVVYDQKTHEAYGLTSRHVLLPNRRFSFRRTAPVIQPNHQWNKRSEIGKVIQSKQTAPDCIRFKIRAERPIATTNSLLGLKGQIQGIASEVYCGMKVMKSGARTGVTYGIIVCESICKKHFTIYPDEDYELIDGELTLPGDSGAVWVVNDGSMQAIGLHCLGNRSKIYDAEMAVALKMSMVADYLQIYF
ncbi:MAG: hypothetical protein AAGD05_14775, partial [Bacteroidota bacterium]